MQSVTNTISNINSEPALPTFSGNSAANDAGTPTNNNDVYGIINSLGITALTPIANEGGSNGVFRLTRANTNGALTVNLTIDGSSTASTADYTLSGGSVTVSGSTLTVAFAAGDSFVDVNLAAIDDIATEPDETLKLNLATGFGYTINSANNTATVTIAANDQNSTPTAVDDNATTNEDTALSGNVLANDTDPDTGDILTVSAVNGSTANVGTEIALTSGALLTLNANGSFGYNPNGQFEFLAVGATATDSFDYTISDGNGGTDTATVTVTINGVNDAATITGTATAAVTEDTATPNLTATGSLTVSDVDTNESIFNTTVTSAIGNLGSLSITSAGAYSYSVANSAVQFLGAGQTKAETFTVKSVDGTASRNIIVTVNGVNDAATITGTATAAVTEDTATPNLTATGSLTVTDADAGQNIFNTTVTSATGNLGSLSITNAGAYSYSVANSAVQFLGAGQTKAETFTVKSVDGTASRNIIVTLNGVNDAATITGTATAAVTEDTSTPNLTATGSLTVTDADAGQNIFNTTVTSATGNLGSLSITNAGAYSYSVANSAVQFLGAGQTKAETFTVNSVDGTASKNITVTINGVNDAPTVANALPDKTTIENSGFNFTVPANTFADIDTSNTLTYTATLDNGNALPSWLTFNATTRIFSGTPVAANVGTIGVKLTAKDNSNATVSDIFNLTVTPLNLTGTSNADTLTGTASNNTISGLAGNDTITGNKGNDTLTGGSGQDRFVYNLGDGVDTITDFGGVGQGVNPSAAVIAATDTLIFQGAGLTGQNLLLTKNGSNLEVSFESVVNSPKVILQNFALENLDNLRKVNGASVDLGNILFNGQTTIQNDFDIFDANSTLTSISRENIVTFLNDNNNSIDGFNNSADVINAQGGNDRIDGKSGNDLLRGGAGNDTLIGGSGNDILVGGADNDTLIGDSGNDEFVYQAFSDRGTTGDAIADFNRNQDKLVLTDLFKSLSYSGTNAIADGYLRFVQSGTSTRVQVDANGGADAFSTLTTLNNFTATNLVIGSNVFV
ncbi:MAG: VCBS domain-containing protein [Nostoc sp.]|uniref:beta strand repeat-containing protein n=1 Tax=Nostoc sp. TaxID=1180 RepID=UPI002FFC1CA4